MSYNDLIRRGDAKRFAHQAIIQRGKHANAAASVDHALAALPAVDPLADPRVQALVEALQAVAQHEASIFFGPDAEKNKRASWRGVMRKIKAALAEIEGSNDP